MEQTLKIIEIIISCVLIVIGFCRFISENRIFWDVIILGLIIVLIVLQIQKLLLAIIVNESYKIIIRCLCFWTLCGAVGTLIMKIDIEENTDDL